MNFLKKITVLASAVMISLSSVSCSIKDSNSSKAFQPFPELQKTSHTSKGRCTETELETTFPAGSGGEMVMMNGKPSFADITSGYLFTEISDGLFDFETLPDLHSLCVSPLITQAVVSPNKGYFIEYCDRYSEEKESMYAYFPPQGEPVKIETNGKVIYHAEFSEDERLFLLLSNTLIYEADLSDGSVEHLCSGFRTEAFDVTDNYLIVYSYNGTIEKFNYRDKYAEEQAGYICEGINADLSEHIYDICSGEDDSIYILTANGLFRHIISGNQTEQIADGLSYSISDPVNLPVSVLCRDDGSFLINYKDGTVTQLKFDPNADNSYTSVLKIISGCENNYAVYRTIREFQAQHPEIKIELTSDPVISFDPATIMGIENISTEESYSDEETENLRKELRSAQDAAIEELEEKKPDIFIFPGNEDQDIISRLMCDLSETESIWNPDNALVHNYSGSFYTVPLYYNMPFMAVYNKNRKNIDSMSDLYDLMENQFSDLQENGSSVYPTPLINEPGLFFTTMILSGNTLFNYQKTPQKTNIEKYFESAVKINNFIEKNGEPRVLRVDPIVNRIFDSQKNYDAFCRYADSGLMTVMPGIICTANDAALLSSLRKKYPDISFIHGFDSSGACLVPVLTAGVFNCSENKDAATEFLRIAASEKVQNSAYSDGIPANINAAQKVFLNTDTESHGAVICGLSPVSGEDANEFTDMIKNNSFTSTASIKNIMSYSITAEDCLKGEITPAQAAQQILENIAQQDTAD